MKNFSIITKVVIGIFAAVMLGILGIVGISVSLRSDAPQQSASQPAAAAPPDKSSDLFKPVPESEFKASCKKVVQQDDGKNIYYKELLKNPNKFIGVWLQFPAKILKIEEARGRTWIQAYISNNYDTAVIDFAGTMKIYEGDIIRIYGVGTGISEGTNLMGISITAPSVEAQYIDKIRSGD